MKSIQSTPQMYEWYNNEWIHLISINPETNGLTYFEEGEFVPYQTTAKQIHFYKDVEALLEQAKEMETNHIADATQENLPVFLYK